MKCTDREQESYEGRGHGLVDQTKFTHELDFTLEIPIGNRLVDEIEGGMD